MNINRLFLYTISYVMIIAASSNDGFTSYYLGIPFAIFLLVDLIFQIFKKSSIAVIHSIFLVFAGYLLLTDRTTNSLLYPLVNQTIILEKDLNITHSEFFQNELDFYYDKPYKEKSYNLMKSSEFIIKEQIVTGHPDFGIRYVFVVENINNKSLFKKFVSNAKRYQPRYGDMSSVYKEFSREKIYIDDYNLNEIKYINSFNRFNIFGILLVWIIYFPVFILFIVLLVIYYRGFSSE